MIRSIKPNVEMKTKDTLAGAPAPREGAFFTTKQWQKMEEEKRKKAASTIPKPPVVSTTPADTAQEPKKTVSYRPAYPQRINAYQTKDGNNRTVFESRTAGLLGKPFVSGETALANAKAKDKQIADIRSALDSVDVATNKEKAAINNLYQVNGEKRIPVAVRAGVYSPDTMASNMIAQYDRQVNSAEYLNAVKAKTSLQEKMEPSGEAIADMEKYLSGNMDADDTELLFNTLRDYYPGFQAVYERVDYELGLIGDNLDDETRADYKKLLDDEITSLLAQEKEAYQGWQAEYDAANAITGKADSMRGTIEQFTRADALLSGDVKGYAQKLAEGNTAQDYADYTAGLAEKRAGGTDFATTPLSLAMLHGGVDMAKEYGIEFSDETMSVSKLLGAQLADSEAELEMAKQAREWFTNSNMTYSQNMIADADWKTDQLANIDWRINQLNGQIALDKMVLEWSNNTAMRTKGMEYYASGLSTWTDEKKDLGTFITDAIMWAPGLKDETKELLESNIGYLARGADLVKYAASPEEKAMMAYLENTDPEMYEYAKKAMHPILETRMTQLLSENIAAYSEQHPVAAAYGSVVEKPWTLFDIPEIVDTALDKEKDINPYGTAFMATRSANQKRAEVRNKVVSSVENPIAKALVGGVYDILMTTADSMLAAPTGHGAAVMALSNATTSALAAAENGANDSEMMLYAALSTMTEYVTEKIPFDKYYEAKDAKSLKQAAIAAFSDAFGEGLSSVGEFVADELIAKMNDSRYQSVREQLLSHLVLNEDYTLREAQMTADTALMKDIGYSVLLGFISSVLAFVPSVAVSKFIAKTDANKNAKAVLEMTEAQADNTVDVDAVAGVYEGIVAGAADEAEIGNYLDEVRKIGVPESPKNATRQVMAPEGIVPGEASESVQPEAEAQTTDESLPEAQPVAAAEEKPAESTPVEKASQRASTNARAVIAEMMGDHGAETVKKAFSYALKATGTSTAAKKFMDVMMVAYSMPESTMSRITVNNMLDGKTSVNNVTLEALEKSVAKDMNSPGVSEAVNVAFDDYESGAAVMAEVAENNELAGVRKRMEQLNVIREKAAQTQQELAAKDAAVQERKAQFDAEYQNGNSPETLVEAYNSLQAASEERNAAAQQLKSLNEQIASAQSDIEAEAQTVMDNARARVMESRNKLANEQKTTAGRNAENSRSGGSASIGEQIATPSVSMPASTVATAANEAGQPMRQWGVQGAQESAILFDDVKKRVYQNGGYTPDSNAAQIDRAMNTIREVGFDEAKSRWMSLSIKEANTADNHAMGASLMAYAAATNNPTAQADIAMRYNELGTEAGRAMQSRKIFNVMDPFGALAYVKRAESKINDGYEREGKTTRVKLSEEAMQGILDAPDVDTRKDAVINAIKELASQVEPTWKDRLNAFRYTAMLGNPRTIFINFMGNVGMAGMREVKDKLAGGIESLAQRAGLIDERTKTGKLVTDSVYREFAKKDAEKHIPNLMEFGKWQGENKAGVDKYRKHFGESKIGKALNWWEKKTGDAMEWGDRIFMTGYYSRSLAGWLQANNVDMATVSEKTLDKARDYAAKETIIAAFREQSDSVKAFNQFVGSLKHGSKGGKIVAALIEGVLPFKQTPVNIVKQGIRYSPLGMVKSMTSDLLQVKKGNLSAAQMIDNLAAGLTGTALVAVGYIMSRAGLLVGALGDDEAWDELTGKQKYSLEIGGYGFTIDWLSPTALPMFVGAALENAMFGKDDLTVWDSLWSIAEPMMEMTMLDSLNSILSGASYAENGLVGVATDALMSYGMQYIPSIAGQLARVTDVNRRTFVADPDSAVSKDVQYAAYKVASRIPGLSYLLEPYVNEWGNTQSYDTFAKVAENAIENFISPGYLSETSLDDVEEALEALNAVTGASVYPTFKKNEFTMKVEENGQYVTKTVKLSPEEYTQYKKSVGQTSHAMLEKLIATKEYNQLPSAVQVDCVKQVYEYAAKKALADARPEYVNGENLTEYMQEYLNSRNPVQAIVDKEKQDSLNSAVTNARSKAKIAISKGDYNSLGALVAAMTTAGREDSSMRSSVTSLMKEEYHKAFLADDDETMSMIEDVLISLDIGYKDSTFSGWRKTWYKAGEKN